MSTVNDLTTPLTFDEIRGSIYNVLAATGATTTTWKPGAVLRTVISGVAIVAAGLSALIAILARSAFLPLASGEWLRLVAFYVYNVVRIEATYATGTVTLTNAGGGVYSLDPGDLVVQNPVTLKTYVNLDAVTINATSAIIISIAATEVGSPSTSFVGEISKMVSALTGVTCANALTLVGYDTESDPALRARCVQKLGALSPNGPADAYGYVARSATRTDGSSIGVTRVRALPDGNGGVDIYLADPTGSVVSSDLALIDTQIQRLVTPLCVLARVHSATPVVVPVTYKVWLYNTSGLTSDDITTAINTEIANYFAAAPIGGDVIDGAQGAIYTSELQSVIGRARTLTDSPLPIVSVSLLAPSGDSLLLNVGEVPVLGDVTPTIIQISAGGL